MIAGLGSIGRRHLRNLMNLGIHDVTVFRTGRGEDEVLLPPEVELEMDLDALLSRRPKAVIISNPTSLHVPVALEAARAGSHILLEKPISHNLEGLEELSRIVNEKGIVVLVGYQFRFHPCLEKIRMWIDDGAIGKPVLAEAQWGEYLANWQPWRDYRTSYSARRDLGGGVILTLSHPIDYLRWLLGEVASVSAEMTTRCGLDVDVEDTAAINLRFVSGALGTVCLDYAQRPASHSLRIVGRNGVIIWDNRDGVAVLETNRGQVCHPPTDFDRNSMFLSEIRHFLACVAGLEQSICPLEDGIQTLRVCLAAKDSAREGRRILV
jgi:predicted dehydrogenase